MGKNIMLKMMMLVCLVFAANTANAEDVLGYLTNKEGKYIGPTVEDHVAAMDTDKNGFADASEVRAFLELKHGKGYESELLEKFEASIKGTSCATPFAKSFY
ncbi:MAG: hypothetical protein Q8S46_06785 [Methylotenera sp.]|nr:hypothetical protein [Methylotenera sp.]MDP1754203.1 hypothetical protein [Methylotenera sp.]MDP2100977.1 hypothetical protein [Methylotenera sp.]MDP2280178.1 hypothetical protein [Methylotenera sp.]MDP2404050.1 hypothetical protein [Methylotenera sp.]